MPSLLELLFGFGYMIHIMILIKINYIHQSECTPSACPTYSAANLANVIYIKLLLELEDILC